MKNYSKKEKGLGLMLFALLAANSSWSLLDKSGNINFAKRNYPIILEEASFSSKDKVVDKKAEKQETGDFTNKKDLFKINGTVYEVTVLRDGTVRTIDVNGERVDTRYRVKIRPEGQICTGDCNYEVITAENLTDINDVFKVVSKYALQADEKIEADQRLEKLKEANKEQDECSMSNTHVQFLCIVNKLERAEKDSEDWNKFAELLEKNMDKKLRKSIKDSDVKKYLKHKNFEVKSLVKSLHSEIQKEIKNEKVIAKEEKNTIKNRKKIDAIIREVEARTSSLASRKQELENLTWQYQSKLQEMEMYCYSYTTSYNYMSGVQTGFDNFLSYSPMSNRFPNAISMGPSNNRGGNTLFSPTGSNQFTNQNMMNNPNGVMFGPNMNMNMNNSMNYQPINTQFNPSQMNQSMQQMQQTWQQMQQQQAEFNRANCMANVNSYRQYMNWNLNLYKNAKITPIQIKAMNALSQVQLQSRFKVYEDEDKYNGGLSLDVYNDYNEVLQVLEKEIKSMPNNNLSNGPMQINDNMNIGSNILNRGQTGQWISPSQFNTGISRAQRN